jgi:hypothetical protein
VEAQPYRRGMQRGPSQVLASMMAGKSSGAPGAALMSASNQQGPRGRRPGARQVMVPRNRPSTQWLEDMGLGPAHEPPGGERSGRL